MAIKESLDPENAQKAISALQRLSAEESAESEETAERTKRKFVVLRPPFDEKDKDPSVSVAWVLQIPEECPDATVWDIVRDVIAMYNVTRSGRKRPVVSYGEAFEVIPARFWREKQVLVKTKLAAFSIAAPSNIVVYPKGESLRNHCAV